MLVFFGWTANPKSLLCLVEEEKTMKMVRMALIATSMGGISLGARATAGG
jgi:hypothetical protein